MPIAAIWPGSFGSTVTWVNGAPPALEDDQLDRLEAMVAGQATAVGIAYTPTDWQDATSPALTDAAPLNNLEQGIAAVAAELGLTYVPTFWSVGWSPPRDAEHLNKIEQGLAANQVAILALP